MSVNEKMTAIADQIRLFTGESKKLTLDDMADEIDMVHISGYNNGFSEGTSSGYALGYDEGKTEGHTSGYNSGYAVGISEGTSQGYTIGFEDGKRSFWGVFQNYGKSEGANYYYAFYADRFDDTTYNPEYDIIVEEGITTGRNVFQGCTLTDIKVSFYANSNSTNLCFYGASKLKRIPLFYVYETTAYDRTFQGCGELVELTMGGTIGKNGFDVSACKKLNRASIESIINALSATISGLTVTLSKEAVDNAFTAEEWDALIATKSNWTIELK